MRPVLTIAGFDPSGGAGILADVKAIHACGAYAAAVATAITVQNTQEVRDAVELPVSLVVDQCAAIFDDLDIAAVKTGMLSSAEMVAAVAAVVVERAPGIPLVVDPVLESETGFPLLEDGLDALRTELFPHATVVTPNLSEAQALSGIAIDSREAMHHAAERIAALGPAAVLVKGGHARFATGTDVLWCGGSGVDLEPGRGLPDHPVHGTGCTLASAIAVRLALGDDVEAAVRAAKRYTESVIATAPAIGGGERRPGHHFFHLHPYEPDS